jgi:hypothetical protein
VLGDYRIAAKGCLLTTRAAKWATVQVGTGRTVSEVAKELDCDWHTVNDAVTTYGKALLSADRKRLNKTTAIGLLSASVGPLVILRCGSCRSCRTTCGSSLRAFGRTKAWH